MSLYNSLSKQLYPFEKIYLIYSGLMLLSILFFADSYADYTYEIISYISVSGFILLVGKYVDDSRSKLNESIRFLYPFFLFSFFYSLAGGTIHLVYENFLDYCIIDFEKSLFGINPTLYIDKNLLNVWTNEFLHATYFSYYFMVPVFMVVMFLKGRIDILKSSITAFAATFSFSFLLFFLFPVEGPRWHYADVYINQIEGPIFRELVMWLMENGAIRGGCMPSTHFAIALVIMMYCFKHYPRMGWALVPINIGLAVGTFWGRFHYVSDLFVGALIGYVVVQLVWKFYDAKQSKLYNT